MNEYKINLNERNSRITKVNLQIVHSSAHLAMGIGKCYTRDVQKVRAKSTNDYLFYYYRNVHVHKIHYE